MTMLKLFPFTLLLFAQNSTAHSNCDIYIEGTKPDHPSEIIEQSDKITVLNGKITNHDIEQWLLSKKDIILCGEFLGDFFIKSSAELHRLVLAPTSTSGNITIENIKASEIILSGEWNNDLNVDRTTTNKITFNQAAFNKSVILTDNKSDSLQIENSNYKMYFADLGSTYRTVNIEASDAEKTTPTFEKQVSFQGVNVHEDFIVHNSILTQPIMFNDSFELVSSNVLGFFAIKNAVLKGSVSFRNSSFEKGVSFRESTFTQSPVLVRTYIAKDLKLEGTQFKNGVDFRMADMENNTHLYLEAVQYEKPMIFGEDQINSSKISVSPPAELSKHPNHEERMRKEYIYELLSDSFKQRGMLTVADQLLYAYNEEYTRLEPSAKRSMYGLFFGYGYQPWRFVIFIMFPLIFLFSILWLSFFHREILMAMSRVDGNEKNFGDINFKMLWLIPIKIPSVEIIDGKDITIPKTISIISALHFSFTIFFSVRFKRQWLDVNDRTFNYTVILEYALGLLSIAIFALGSRVASFDVIKNILGI